MSSVLNMLIQKHLQEILVDIQGGDWVYGSTYQRRIKDWRCIHQSSKEMSTEAMLVDHICGGADSEKS